MMISRRAFARLVAALGLAAAARLPVASGRSLGELALIPAAEWEAQPPLRPLPLVRRKAKGIVIHHTARPNVSATSREHALAVARQIQSAHFERGFGDSGHHFTVTRGGYVLEARQGSLEALRSGQLFLSGAHTPNANDTHIGIECEGTYSAELPPPALWSSLVALCALICERYEFAPSRIDPHGDWSSTECPGARFGAELPALRGAVAELLAAQPRQWPLLREGDWRRAVHAAQLLLAHHGFGLAVDGIFTPAMTSALQSFQRAQSLAPSGILNAETWPLLVVPLTPTSRGAAVQALQSLLGLAATGSFESALAERLRSELGTTSIVAEDWQRWLT